MKAFFDHSRRESPTVTTFYFRAERPLSYLAGQFVEVTLNHPNPDNRGIKRWFSLSSSPIDELFSITTRTAIVRPSTFTQQLKQLHVGSTIEVSTARGTFTLPDNPNIPLLFVAGGIGITTFHSMLSFLLKTKDKRHVQVVYAVRDEADVIFQETLNALEMEPVVVVERPSETWQGAKGMLTPEFIIKANQLEPDALIYLSGPASMVESLANGLHELGIGSDQLIVDAFSGYQNI